MPANLQVCFNFGTAKPVKLKVFFAYKACLHPRKRVGELVISILNWCIISTEKSRELSRTLSA